MINYCHLKQISRFRNGCFLAISITLRPLRFLFVCVTVRELVRDHQPIRHLESCLSQTSNRARFVGGLANSDVSIFSSPLTIDSSTHVYRSITQNLQLGPHLTFEGSSPSPMNQNFSSFHSSSADSSASVIGDEELHSNVVQLSNEEKKSYKSGLTKAEEDNFRKVWEREQNELILLRRVEDVDEWALHQVTVANAAEHPNITPLRYIGGVDLSFVKNDSTACAALVVLELPTLQIVYKDLRVVQMTAPYIPGFLAFREVPILAEIFEDLRKNRTDVLPQVLLVDGNGILHPKEFGEACHLGVVLDIPCVGVAKNLHMFDGLERDYKYREQIDALQTGDTFPLITNSGKQLGIAFLGGKDAKKPIFLSPGHKVSMETALWVTKLCCSRYRIPEPTRQADILSREYIRENFPTAD